MRLEHKRMLITGGGARPIMMLARLSPGVADRIVKPGRGGPLLAS
jgi:hypothetical protein